MVKPWKDIKVGDVMKDGSVVTEIHRTHDERCCVVNYADNQEFTCSYNHILLIDVHNLPIEGKKELEEFCTFVPLEECYEINGDELTVDEKLIVDKFFHNEKIDIGVRYIGKVKNNDIYEFAFDIKKIVKVTTVTIKSEPQKVDENTYWLTCSGISYLMSKYKVDLYCNENIINSITDAGVLPCFCITTDTGRYET